MYISDDDPYGRLRLIPWWDQARLSASRVLVVGAGAIGNEVLKNLALLGVGQIYVVDFDSIEMSNLSRSVLFRRRDQGRAKAEVAADAIREMNPDIAVRAIHGNIMTDVGLGVFQHVDVVIGCLDNREARLWVNRQCWKVNTPWIDAGIQEINGVVKVFIPPETACYECAMTEMDYRLINLRYSCPLLSRDQILAGKVPTSPTIASMMAGLQVQEALKVLHGLTVRGGVAHVYNGVGNQWYTTEFQRREQCLSHETYDEFVSIPLSARKHSARDLIDEVRRLSGEEKATSAECDIQLDRDLVVSLDCECGLSRRIMKPAGSVGMRAVTCPGCGGTARPIMVHSVAGSDTRAAEQLVSLGIPPYDIVRVRIDGREWRARLDGDRASTLLD